MTQATQPRLPVCGDGLVAEVPTPVSCAGEFVIATPVSSARGRPLLTRMQAVHVSGGQKATFVWQMRDRLGNPVNLSSCLCTDGSESSSLSMSSSAMVIAVPTDSGNCTYKMKFRLREYIRLSQGSPRGLYETDAVEVDASKGLFNVTVDPVATHNPGVYFGELGLVGVDTDGLEFTIFSNTFYVYVDRGNWSQSRHPGPPSIAEIRLHLRDSSPAESFLLDNIRFDDAEIAHAAASTVQQFNEMPPPLNHYTTSSFPFRYHWLTGICSHLFRIAAEQYRANNLKYSAAGLSVDDQDKEVNYDRAAQDRRQEWLSFVKTKKAELNISLGFGSYGSHYRW